MTTIGSRIRKLREGLNLDQTVFADKIGIARTHFGMIELGIIKAPKPDTLQKIANGLGLTLSQLVENVDFLSDKEV